MTSDAMRGDGMKGDGMKGEGGVSAIVRAGDYESVHYALALAAAALAVNKPAVLFFTMAGIRALCGPPPQLDDWARDADNRARGVGDFETLLKAAKASDLHP